MEWKDVQPVLAATYELLATDDHISGDAVTHAVERPPNDEDTGRALQELHDAGYTKGQFVMQTRVPVLISATEKGLQETSGWPKPGEAGPDQIELLLQLLDERINSEDTPDEEKGKLRQIREGVVDASRDIIVRVLSDYASRASGLS